MTALRYVRETLRALKDDLASTSRPRFLWVSHQAGETHAEAVTRTLSQQGLTGDEPGLVLVSWKHPELAGERTGVIQ